MHTCDPSIQETEAGRSQVQGQFRLQSKSQKVNQTTTKGEKKKKKPVATTIPGFGRERQELGVQLHGQPWQQSLDYI